MYICIYVYTHTHYIHTCNILTLISERDEEREGMRHTQRERKQKREHPAIFRVFCKVSKSISAESNIGRHLSAKPGCSASSEDASFY